MSYPHTTIIMPPPLEHPSLHLKVLDQTFIVCKFPPDTGLPADVLSAITKPEAERQLFSLTRTQEETSLVFAVGDVTMSDPDLPRWRCIKIKGPMEFGSPYFSHSRLKHNNITMSRVNRHNVRLCDAFKASSCSNFRH